LTAARSTRTCTSSRPTNPRRVLLGITTLIGGGTGPATGPSTTCSRSVAHRRMYEAVEAFPLNSDFSARATRRARCAPRADLCGRLGGSCTKIGARHRPPSINPVVPTNSTSRSHSYRHVERSRLVEDTIRAIAGRTIHTYHTEAPERPRRTSSAVWRAERPSVVPNPTMPFTRTPSTSSRHDDGDPSPVAERRRMWRSPIRARAETIGAEDVLHDLGALSMMCRPSDGRIGEVICRTGKRGQDEAPARPLPGGRPAATTPRPPLRREVHDQPGDRARHRARVGSIEVGKLADLGSGSRRSSRQAGAGDPGARRHDGRRTRRSDPSQSSRGDVGAFGGARQACSVHSSASRITRALAG